MRRRRHQREPETTQGTPTPFHQWNWKPSVPSVPELRHPSSNHPNKTSPPDCLYIPTQPQNERALLTAFQPLPLSLSPLADNSTIPFSTPLRCLPCPSFSVLPDSG
ncbi:hypothetical protein VTJ04DRAFT_3247 [Mycothermus thermophilus]|uniref:uncharacterized protein n=1 Tax=Humicola insolens TaxID=85995 RepID=UPI0037434F75